MSTKARKARKRAERTAYLLASVRKQLRIRDDHGFARPEPKDADA